MGMSNADVANAESDRRAISSKQEAQLAVLREIRALMKEQRDLLEEIKEEVKHLAIA